MLIESLSLKNVRSYESLDLVFDSGITFLSGDIGSGKSSILQAIEFCLFGFKRGDLEGFQLLRKGKSEGYVILRLKNSKGDIYEIARFLKKAKSSISQENGYVSFNGEQVDLSPTEITAKVFEILSFPMDFIKKDKNLIFRFTTYTPQEQLKEVLYSDVEKRLEIIRKVFSIDKYKQLKNAISIYLSKLRDDKTSFKSKLEVFSNLGDDREKLKIELDLKSKEFLDLKKVFEDFNKDLNSQKGKVRDILDKKEVKTEFKVKVEKNLVKLNEIERQLIEIDKDINLKVEKKKDFGKDYEISLKEKIKSFEDKILVVNKNLEVLAENRSSFEEELKTFEVKRDELKLIEDKFLEFKETESKIKVLRKSFDLILTKCKIKDLEVNISKVKQGLNRQNKFNKKIDEVLEKISKIEVEVKILDNNLEDLKEKYSNLDKLVDCPVCFQKVDENHKKSIKDEFKGEFKNLTDKKNKFLGEIEDLNKEKKKLEKSLEDRNFDEELIELQTKMEVLVEQFEKEESLQKEVESLNKKLEDGDFKSLNLQKEKLEKKLKSEEKVRVKLKEISEKFDKNKDLKSSLELNIVKVNNLIEGFLKLDEEILNLENKKKKFVEVLKKKDLFLEKEKEVLKILNELNEKLLVEQKFLDEFLVKEKDFLEKITLLKTVISEKKEVLLKLDKNFEEFEKLNLKLSKVLNVEEFLSKKVVNVSSLIEKALFTKFYVEFNEEFEKFFKILIEDNELDVRLDDEFSPVVEQNGYEVDIKNLSGGERSSLALAYRLALRKIIESNLPVSQDRLSLLVLDEPTDGFSSYQVERLGELLKGLNLGQIFVVSHDSKVDSIADRIVNVEKVNHKSKVMF